MAEKFLLFSVEGYSMVSSWEDSLYCSILKNGTLSLRLNKYSVDVGSLWSKSVRGIRTPREFIDGFQSDEFYDFSYSCDFSDLFPALFKRLPKFALTTSKFVSAESDKQLEIVNSACNLLLSSDYQLPTSCEEATIVFERLFAYVEKYFAEHGELPSGSTAISGQKIVFRQNQIKHS